MRDRKDTKIFQRILAIGMLAAIALMTSGCGQLMVLDPKGPIGSQQRDLIYISTWLCLIVIVPVLVLTAWIVWRYREKKGNKAAYQPKWEHSTRLETIWWGIPIVVIVILAIVTARYTHALEPAKPLQAAAKPITIQVTSLDWKWLFQYPEQGIATVNYLQFPEDVPVKFVLTSDGPMNSFWLPQLGGQIYTMSGMATTLHLQADEPGEYFGSGANFTGRDFAKMAFTAKATSQADFDKWVREVKSSGTALTDETFLQLSKPAASEPRVYSSIPSGLFDRIVNKYGPAHNHGEDSQSKDNPASHGGMHQMDGMNMDGMDMKQP